MTWKIFDKLFFMGPTGLGDTFVINGIVHHFADRCHELHLPIASNYIETNTALYSGYNNIIPVPLWPDQTTYALEDSYCKEHNLSRVLRTPTWWGTDTAGVGMSPLWDQQMYTFFELPFEKRYTNFRLPKHIPGTEALYNLLNPNNEPFILIHTGVSYKPEGISVTIENRRNLKVIDLTNPASKNMLDYISLIANAEEIHCVPSAFYCFVDSVCLHIKAELYYHNIRKSTMLNVSNVWNEHRWKIVDYKEKLI